MLAIGPAIATRAGPIRWLLRLYGLNGTGFPHPNPANSKSSVPQTSICTKGFIERRPIFFAVGSPKALATAACENSWIVMAMTIAASQAKNKIGSDNNRLIII